MRDLRAVLSNQQQIDVDSVHWQGRWPEMGRAWGHKQEPGSGKQFLVPPFPHPCKAVGSFPLLVLRRQEMRAQARSHGQLQGRGLTGISMSTWWSVQLVCPVPGKPPPHTRCSYPSVGIHYNTELLPPVKNGSEFLGYLSHQRTQQ